MPDLLVKLYKLKNICDKEQQIEQLYNIRFVRVMTPNKSKLLQFVSKEFCAEWADEASAAFARQPVSCFAAVDKDNNIVGFAAYECTCRGFFGPTGVSLAYRNKGIGEVLLIKSLQGLKDMGYAYAIIGGANLQAAKMYMRACAASLIEDSEQGIYTQLI